jgi:glycosyltransferase involved in cell wall biosynthesis
MKKTEGASMKFLFITDPLITTEGAVRPALLLAKQLRHGGHNVEIASTQFTEEIVRTLELEGMQHSHVGSSFSIIQSSPTLSAWARALIKPAQMTQQEGSDIVINTSSCIVASSEAYYAQGTMTRTLDDISTILPARYMYSYKLVAPPLKFLDRRLVEKFRRTSKLFVANSIFCASIYKELGFNVDCVIHPPLDCALFKPSTSKPSEDYVLTHIGTYGKEGKLSLIKAIAEAGVRIKIFGKEPHNSRRTENKNITFLGKVSNRKLVELYSNAVFTLFAFNHEPFGYIPIESMACGTPVLTFNRQGPAETITDSQTGWLTKSDEELVKMAIGIWKIGVNGNIRAVCRRNALEYDVEKVTKEWISILKTADRPS